MMSESDHVVMQEVRYDLRVYCIFLIWKGDGIIVFTVYVATMYYWSDILHFFKVKLNLKYVDWNEEGGVYSDMGP